MDQFDRLVELLLSPGFPWTQIARGGGDQTVTVRDAVQFVDSKLDDDMEVELLLDEVITGCGGRRIRPTYVPLGIKKIVREVRWRLREHRSEAGDVYEMPMGFFESHGQQPPTRGHSYDSMG